MQVAVTTHILEALACLSTTAQHSIGSVLLQLMQGPWPAMTDGKAPWAAVTEPLRSSRSVAHCMHAIWFAVAPVPCKADPDFVLPDF